MLLHSCHAYVGCPRWRKVYVVCSLPFSSLYRWGNPTQLDDLCDVRQVLTFMNCLLEVSRPYRASADATVQLTSLPQGLIFLHAKRIAHRVSHKLLFLDP